MQTSKTEIALSNIALSLLSAIGVLAASQTPWFIGMPTFSAVGLTAAGVIGRNKKHELTLRDYWEAVPNFSDDVELALDPILSLANRADPLVDRFIVPRIPPIAKTLLDVASAEKDDSWMTPEMILASKFVLGAKNTGKSEWIRFEARRFKAENPHGILRIIDIHYDPDEPWLLGMGDESDYVASDAATGMAFIREMDQLGKERIKNKDKNGVQYKLIIDEFQGFCSRPETDQKVVVDAIQFSQDELRKYHFNVTLTSKSFKEKMTGLDSSIVSQMDFLALGTSLADSTNKLPHDINAKELTQKRSAVAALPGCKYACVYRELGEEPQIRVIPADLPDRSAQYVFQTEDYVNPDELWLEGQKPMILEMQANGHSQSHIAGKLDGLGRQANSNPRFLLYKAYLAEIRQ